ncbi:MFS transporter [Paenibacillus elgii]
MLGGLVALTIVTIILGFQSNLNSIIVVFALSCMSAGSGIVGQVFSSFISSHLGWQYVFIILAAIYFILTLLMIFFIPTLPANGVRIAETFKLIGKTLGQKSLWFAFVIALVMLLSFVGMYTALGKFLSSPLFGFSNEQILCVRSVGIIGMVLSLFASTLVKKFSLIPVPRSAIILSAASLILLGFGSNMVYMIVISVVFVSGIAVAIPSLVSLVGELGGAARGAAISIYTVIVNLGATIDLSWSYSCSGPAIMSLRFQAWRAACCWDCCLQFL